MARDPSNPPADDGFLSRWSRRKAAERDGTDAGAAPALRQHTESAVPTPAERGAPPDPPVAARAPTAKPETPLPTIESLTAESDYTAFLRPDVPAAVQRAALRKLWSSVPELAPIEIAEAHMGDFNAVPTFPDGLKDTIFDAVRGLVERRVDPAPEKAPLTGTAEPSPNAATIVAEARPAPRSPDDESAPG